MKRIECRGASKHSSETLSAYQNGAPIDRGTLNQMIAVSEGRHVYVNMFRHVLSTYKMRQPAKSYCVEICSESSFVNCLDVFSAWTGTALFLHLL